MAHKSWLTLITLLWAAAPATLQAAESTSFWKVWNVWNNATVTERIAHYGDLARTRLTPYFQRAGLCYPPRHVTLLGLKEEKRLEVYAGDDPRQLKHIRSYPIFAASGQPGPKLKEGDKQVPEGIYSVQSLNPNSNYHLALRVGYPNSFDLEMARHDGRRQLGGDIMIHGRNSSVGCLAMGDPAVEELFVLAADAGTEQMQVVIAPVDLRVVRLPDKGRFPAWSGKLYGQLREAMARMPLPLPLTTVVAEEGNAPQCRQPLRTARLTPP